MVRGGWRGRPSPLAFLYLLTEVSVQSVMPQLDCPSCSAFVALAATTIPPPGARMIMRFAFLSPLSLTNDGRSLVVVALTAIGHSRRLWAASFCIDVSRCPSMRLKLLIAYVPTKSLICEATVTSDVDVEHGKKWRSLLQALPTRSITSGAGHACHSSPARGISGRWDFVGSKADLSVAVLSMSRPSSSRVNASRPAQTLAGQCARSNARLTRSMSIKSLPLAPITDTDTDGCSIWPVIRDRYGTCATSLVSDKMANGSQ